MIGKILPTILIFLAAHRIISAVVLLVLIALLVFLILWQLPSLYGSKQYSLDFESHARKYLVHLPRHHDKTKRYPLVFVFHGYSNSPKLAEWYTGFSKKADKEGFIVVYPRGYSKTDPLYLVWNAGFCCHNGEEKQADDVGLTKALIDELSRNYPIDQERIYVTGFSNGGMMAHRLGAELSDVLAAIAPVSGAIGGTTKHMPTDYKIQTPKNPLPVLIIHGQTDAVVPYNGGANRHGTFSSVQDAVTFWQNNSAPIELVAVPDGDHIWFGGNYDKLKHPFRKTINATDIIWDFFSQHKKN